MLAYDVDDRHLRSARIVQIGKTVSEARAKMQQGARWFSRHSRISVGGARHDALKKAQYAPHLRDMVECLD
jgi:hypothetical protein